MAESTLRDIHAFPELVRYLEDKLGWPLQEYGFDDLTFEYTPAELGLKEEDAARIKAIHQLRPLIHGQPWGIFFVEFEHKKLPVVVLRRILSHLVIKKRVDTSKAAAPAWHAEDLLFVTAFGEDGTDNREIAFAHFHQNPGDLPTLHVLGWDGGDTPLKLTQLDQTLRERLHWPEDESDADAWRLAWSKPFKHKIGHVIRTADLLAEELARLARGIRDKARRMLAAESEKGPLTKLFKAFQTALIHDLSEASFADTYAQTITYGLLTAAISRTEMSEGRHGTALLADDIANIVPVTNPFLKEMLQTFLKVGGRRGGIDFDELGIQDVVELLRGDETDLPAVIADFGNKNPNEDPVIHFYEHFLAAYDKPQKKQRGVFYTPQPVVSYIVRSVHELLQTEFGLEDGLASTITWGEMAARQIPPSPPLIKGGTEANTSALATAAPPFEKGGPGGGSPFAIPAGTSPDAPFVTILDPATGTATFLVEVINVIHRTLTEKWKKQGLNEAQRQAAWNDYVPAHLLPRLYGYELMMAPYAIAHMKIGLKLYETGYRFGSEERVRMYLTNALEPAHEVQAQLEVLAPALAHEAQAVAGVKREVRFTVVVGNPPYAGISSNMADYAQHIVDAYRIVDGVALNEKKVWLQDDYVKFIRKAQTTIESAGTGVLGYITNHGYLNNPTFRGMRQSLMGTFQCLRLLDLHGNANKKEQSPDGSEDKNVFDIRQGVAICLAMHINATASVKHADLWGTREYKYGWLSKHHTHDTGFSQIEPNLPFYLFEPQNSDDRAEYEVGIPITEVFPINTSGIVTARDGFVIDFDDDEIKQRMRRFLDARVSDEDIKNEFNLSENYTWRVSEARKELREEKGWEGLFKSILYRPFDSRRIIYHRSVVFRTRKGCMRHMFGETNLALSMTRSVEIGRFEHVFCAREIIGHHTVSLKEVNYLFPLWLLPDEDGLLLSHHRHPNLGSGFLKALSIALRLPQERAHGLPLDLTPEAIVHYIYAILHSPTYRIRYADFLKIDFPRIPLPGDLPLFQSLAELGGELVALHLLESPKVNAFITRFEGQGDNSIPKKPTYKDGAVWINASQRFEGVPEAVWNFHVGGYQVCEKWLKDRKGRILSAEDIAHYQRIVVALNETIRLMAEIDRMIETHGGWPGAFASNTEAGAPA